MKCSKCGQVSQPDARFCSACGNPLHDASGETTTLLAVVSDERVDDVSVGDLEQAAKLAPGNALLVVKRGGAAGARFLIDTDTTTVGRHPQSDIFLDDVTVSRHHARFVRRGAELVLEDLGSLNGTYVNGHLIEAPVVLHQADEIQIGKFRTSITLSEAGQA